MVRLSVLGTTDLRLHGDPVSRVLAQPKRLALLAYLVLARPGSFQRRDHLLGLFWPSSTSDRARANLRQAVRFLRKSLGEDAVVGRGDGELAVGAGVLGCDALEFRAALDRGDPEGALRSYGGDLLPGLFVSGAPDFERWLAGERRELREAARDASAALSEAAEAAGRGPQAIDWARRSVHLDPVDEVSTRRLIRLLMDGGARAEAVKVYEELRDRLAAELELSPSSETRALVVALRQGGGATPPLGPVEGSPGLDPLRVAVLPYRSSTRDSRQDQVGAMAADWIAQGLARNPELSVVPPFVARGLREEEPAWDLREEVLARFGAELEVGTLVTGAVEDRGGELVLRTMVFDATRRRLLPSPDDVVSPLSDPLEGLAELRDRVAGSLAPLLSSRPVHARQAGRPPSYEAYRAYLLGLDRFIGGDWLEALEEFRPVLADGGAEGYPLPALASAIALWNLGRLDEAQERAASAARHRESMGSFERGTLDMVTGWLEGDWRKAYAGARRQAELAPASLPAFQVAEEARRLNRPREALTILSGLDPLQGELEGWVYYWVELCTAHHLLGDHRAELEAARRAVALHPGHALATLLEVRALAAVGEVDLILESAYRILGTPEGGSPSPGALLRRIAHELQAHGHALEGARSLELSREWWTEQPPSPDPVHRREWALTLYHGGRLEGAREVLRELRATEEGGLQPLDEHHGHLRGHLDEGCLALIAERLGDPDDARRWRQRLEDDAEPFRYGARWLWRAALAARAGELDRGVSYLRRALIEGLPFSLALHTHPELEPLRSHPGYRGILAPKG